MNTPNYAEMLPNSRCNPQDAIEALIEKVPRYINEWLFKVPDFVQLFAESVTNIMNNLPENLNERKPVEIELAYIIHNLYVNHGVVIAHHQQQAYLRAMELELSNKWVLSDYLSFAYGKSESIDTNNIDALVLFLGYLGSYCTIGIRDVALYLKTCVRLSQLEGWAEILMAHLSEKFSLIPSELIDKTIEDQKWYFWIKSSEFEDSIHDIMEEEDISYEEAEESFLANQREVACLYFYIWGLYNEYILPKINTLTKKQKNELFSLLNDFRDIVDPEWFMPMYFFNGNGVEFLERGKILDEGREVH